MSNDSISTRVKQIVRRHGWRYFLLRAVRYIILMTLRLPLDLQSRLLRACARRRGRRLWLLQVNRIPMYVNLLDEGLSMSLLQTQTKEPFSTMYMRKFLKPGDLVIDVGANIGYYALLEAKLVGSNGKVIALEPVSESRRILLLNVAINSLNNVIVYPYAAGEHESRDYIFIHSKRNISHIGKARSQFIKKELVRIIPLDRLLNDGFIPNVVRMDVEGYEYFIIRGMKRMLQSNNSPRLFIELHPFLMGEERTLECLELLERSGYVIVAAFSEPAEIETFPNLLDRKVLLHLVHSLSVKMRGMKYGLGKVDVSFKQLKEDINYLCNSGKAGAIHLFLIKRAANAESTEHTRV